MKKIQLNKTTIARLTDAEMSKVEGGFTYSLSWGTICSASAALQSKSDKTYAEAKEICQSDSERERILEAAARLSFPNCG